MVLSIDPTNDVHFEILPKENPLNAFLSKLERDTNGCRIFLTYFRNTTRSYRVRLFLGELFVHICVLFLAYWIWIAEQEISSLFPFIPEHLFTSINYVAPYATLIAIYLFSWPFFRGKFYTHIRHGFPVHDIAFHKPALWILSDTIDPVASATTGKPVYAKPIDENRRRLLMERADLKIDHPLLHPWSPPDVALERAAYAAASRSSHTRDESEETKDIPIDVWEWSFWEKIEGSEQWKVWQIWRGTGDEEGEENGETS
ncbi:hypothetical protein SISNIDRAFT_462175 [Sistotremastrum niveocremeum HHB9708]|uniref:Uncharacterized protein n=1 Tax=Sistotremastrum niveocremeum HHB9708 TaxID=1314777 RepID=A0A164ZVM7_9AGAM|nr:hypothetical protein SISNIDRAFT_462175 [Sistotremastrum niveocremeum HHB9708]